MRGHVGDVGLEPRRPARPCDQAVARGSRPGLAGEVGQPGAVVGQPVRRGDSGDQRLGKEVVAAQGAEIRGARAASSNTTAAWRSPPRTPATRRSFVASDTSASREGAVARGRPPRRGRAWPGPTGSCRRAGGGARRRRPRRAGSSPAPAARRSRRRARGAAPRPPWGSGRPGPGPAAACRRPARGPRPAGRRRAGSGRGPRPRARTTRGGRPRGRSAAAEGRAYAQLMTSQHDDLC